MHYSRTFIWRRRTLALAVLVCGFLPPADWRSSAGAAEESIQLVDNHVRLSWQRQSHGWQLSEVVVRSGDDDLTAGTPSGEYTFLFSDTPPSTDPVKVPWSGPTGSFPEPTYGHVAAKWKQATTPVALNLAGQAEHFFPEQAIQDEGGTVSFTQQTPTARIRAMWQLDPQFPGDLRVTVTLTARKDGYFSIASPTLARIPPADLSFALVPGVFAGEQLAADLVRAYGYGQGLPTRSVLARERSTATLASIASHQSGATLAVIAEPGTATDPWERDRDTRQQWRLGLSHMNRRSELTPTLYHPVLGQVDSKMTKGDTRTFRFRYSLRAGDWLEMLNHVAYDVYQLRDFLAMKQPARSLSQRVRAMRSYVTDSATSMWRTEQFGGRTIGAQAYLGGVVGADGDAMKNSDYGAMWMLARITEDPVLLQQRLPFARAFKLVQQQAEPGFFQGAAVGQYYLSKSKRFAEEWGAYVEPVALTYYVLSDLGNVLLFEPEDEAIRQRLRLGADRLLSWQHADGHWEVAYDRATGAPMFTDLTDLRPTFYGLLIAYRMLGDEKYLAAARRGADWLIAHAVSPRHFLGVCGDVRFAPDFATGQIAQALLDLHEITGEPRYRDAGVAAAKFYATSVFTHPLASTEEKSVQGVPHADWQINQTGLSFEHGGTLGSANNGGPILLASHAGLFIRVHQLTGEPLLRDLARAGVLAREAFVDPDTSVASYYWTWMDRGPGRFPHHAWWQIGWITDYLLAEATLRSAGQIDFPRGFFTPKVGPHAAYGFAPGKIFGEEAALAWGDARADRAEIDTIAASATGRQRIYFVLMNSSAHEVVTQVAPVAAELTSDAAQAWRSAAVISATGARIELPLEQSSWQVTLPAFGLTVFELEWH